MRKKALGRVLSACLMAGALSVPQAGLAAPGAPVRIDAEHFPDDAFRAFVVQYDGNGDGVLSLAERMAVRQMDLGPHAYSTLEGIQNFEKLEVLRGSGASKLEDVDLSQLQDLKVLDLRGAALGNLQAASLSLVSAHGKAAQSNFAEQKPVVIALADGEDSFDLAALDPHFAEGNVTGLEGGATLSGTVLEGLIPGQRITYVFESDGFRTSCTLDVRRENSWAEEPAISNWAVGDEPVPPAGQAAHGEVQFLYGSDSGTFSDKAPANMGSYVLRAVVPPDAEYAGLEAEVPFLVVPQGVDPGKADEVPSLLEATYGDTLSDIKLPAGYTWRNPDSSVGVVGINKFQAVYRDPDGGSEIVTLNVRVMPRDGATLDISPIDNEYDANHIVIKDGDVTLVKGTDYLVTNSVEADEVTVTIHFMGNYTGEVVRQFTFDLENAWIIPLTAPGWTYGETPRLPQAEARYGETVYTYATVTDPDAAGGGTVGEFSAAVPENAGTYVVRASVPSTIYYTSLSAEERFTIAKANPSFDLPTGIMAYYTTQLRAVQLPEGFSFTDPTETVGNVGEHTFEGLYTPPDTANYNTVPVQIQVTVLPKNGSNFQVDQITTEAQAENPVVRDGNTVLVKNTDYTVTIQKSGTQLTLTINFIGNYTGQLVRTYTITQAANNNQNQTTGGGTTSPGTNDRSDLGWHVTWMLASAGVIGGSIYLLRRRKPVQRRSRS